jgi:tRNA1(Val) A37 N6-methylase TrmN6
MSEAINCSINAKLNLSRLRMVHPVKGECANRVLLEFTKGIKSGPHIPVQLDVYDHPGVYSTETKTILRMPS